MTTQLFDEHGRRIPFKGMRVYNQVSRQYFRTNQPNIDFGEIYNRSAEYMNLQDMVKFSAEQFANQCQAMLEGLQNDSDIANIANGIQVPFICPPMPVGIRRDKELQVFAKAVGKSFEDRFPGHDFRNITQKQAGMGEDAVVAAGSRYENFEDARCQGVVVGWYFATCLSEYDIDSQRAQMASLPPQFVLSGGVEAAAALVGCPDLLLNKEVYPHHLCLSALQDPDERFFYSFEAYGLDLRFNRRSNIMTPTVKQLSEQFAGGLTVFTVCK